MRFSNFLRRIWSLKGIFIPASSNCLLKCLLKGIRARVTELVFSQAKSGFEGAYHFAFNIPENQFYAAKDWIAHRIPILKDVDGQDEFDSESWNSQSIYFKDSAGNVLEFIARHDLKNGIQGDFGADQILNVSEIGLASEDVIAWANELCSTLGLSVFRQEPNESFTPVGDDNGLFILPVKGRMWIPNSGVPADLLPLKVRVSVNGQIWEIGGYPYKINRLTPSIP